MDGRPKRIKKFAFTSVCVYNRLRVDGALLLHYVLHANCDMLILYIRQPSQESQKSGFMVPCIL